MSAGLRCDMGCGSWPDLQEFKTCPVCGSNCSRFNNLNPVSVEEARSIANHARFEEYYESYCAERGVSVDGPLAYDGLDELDEELV